MPIIFLHRHNERVPSLPETRIRTVYYLPTNAPEREIRFVEVNELIADRNDEHVDPLDFGVDTGSETAHKLLVLDVTPQWEKIQQAKMGLPFLLRW